MCSGPVALDEQRAALRVQAEGQQRRRHLAGPGPQQDRIVGARQGVVVDDAVDRLVLPLQPDVVADRAQVVAEVDDPGRLDAGEDARPVGSGGRAARARAASSVVMVAECSGPRSPGDRPGDARRLPSPMAVGYHACRMSTHPALRVAVLGAGTVGGEVVRAPARAPGPAARRRRRAARARRRRLPRPRPRPATPASRPTC